LDVAFVSMYAVRGVVGTRRLHAPLKGGRMRHFQIVHNENRTLTASGRAFMEALEASGRR
jgi:hypothetical protein